MVYKDLILMLEVVIEGENIYVVYYLGEVVFDFLLDCYVFCYMIFDKDVDIEFLN